jgi:uncharacterized Ntn-hydrolase superfamily protein
VGVVHAQALFNGAARQRAVQLLSSGQSPDQVLSAITDLAFDPRVATRQYAAVDVSGRIAAFTGADAQTFAGDVQGQSGAYTYSVQGNILTSAAVLTQAAQAFEANGCDLAERLMAGLAAGASGGEGDSRCTAGGIPSDSAFLQVDAPEAAPGTFLSLRVPSSGTADPLVLLADLFAQWRTQNPCPAAVRDAGSAGPLQPTDASLTSSPQPGATDAGASHPDPSSTALETPAVMTEPSSADAAAGPGAPGPASASSGASCALSSAAEGPSRPPLGLALFVASAALSRGWRRRRVGC